MKGRLVIQEAEGKLPKAREEAPEITLEVERPKTLSQFNIFDQVFVKSLLADAIILREANELLNSTINDRTIIITPVR